METKVEVVGLNMWQVFEHKKAAKVIDKAPKQVQEKYDFWKQTMERDGPDGVKYFSGFRDHALKGEWKGYRSSYLNDQYRVIYELDKKRIMVFVEHIGPHDY